jgi:arylsulfatase
MRARGSSSQGAFTTRRKRAACAPLAPNVAVALRPIRLDFAYDGGGLGQGGEGTLYVNDEQVAEGRIPHTQAIIFSADETADIGIDRGTPVVEAIGAEQKSRFTGHILKLTVEVRDVNPRGEVEVQQAQREVRQRTQVVPKASIAQ